MRRAARLVPLALLGLPVARGCTGSTDCAATCAAAGGGSNCTGIRCNARYLRCECAGAAVFRVDGTCELPDLPPPVCEPEYDAVFSVAAKPSPELQFTAAAAGVPPAPFVTLLRLGAEAAALRSPGAFNVSSVKAIASSTGGLFSFDLLFSFCGPEPLAAPDLGEFSRLFRRRVQDFEAFRSDQNTVELLTLARRGGPINALSGWHSGPATAPDTGSGGSNTGAILAIAFLVSAFCVAVAGVATFIVLRRRKLRRVALAPSEEDLKEAVVEGGEAEGAAEDASQTVLAHVAAAFGPTDVEDDKAFRECCLEVKEGDVVEVVAGGSGWLYGRITGDGEPRTGFFPENRVSWVGRVPGAEPPPDCQRPLVTATFDFSPKDLEAPEAAPDPCLSLTAGEIVEVLASGEGWLYGQVVGSPERLGYVPENRVTFLRQPATSEDAAREGRLVHVRRDFSPGNPGDAEEEVPFSESCLAVAEGDLVEVLAAGGGWIFGRVVGAPERSGYLPETRVAWLGRPLDEVGGLSPPGNGAQQLPAATEAALRAAAAAVVAGQGRGDDARAPECAPPVDPVAV